ncbi:tetratricopeptide repeat protein [Streptomyces sp. NPDC127098]|uniref:tetratricopeptide repeat protein n=1 Tax=Streptomyces sp. NPDC127098 TaxID=3347137 RepID=UPI00364ACA7E
MGRPPSRTAASPFPPLAVPQRKVPVDRLRGRDKLLAEVAGAIGRRVRGGPDVPGVWVLSGLGGCGKTTVALEIAHRLSPAMRHLWWTSAEDRQGLSGALQAVAYQAGAQDGEFGHGHPADVLWRRLDDLAEPWLLVLDNIDEPADLAAPGRPLAQAVGWLRPPKRACGIVLITSRESRPERWAPWAHIKAMDVLNVDHASRVLLDLAPGAGDEREARELARHLGGLPLALDLAGSYLARAREELWPSPDTPGTFTAYRDSVDQRLDELAADQDAFLGEPDRQRRAIGTTWQLSLALLKRQGHAAAETLLWLLSSLGQAPVPLGLLDPDVLLGSGLFGGGTSRSQLGDALRGLAGLRLIKLEHARVDGSDSAAGLRRIIDVHPLVRASNRQQADYLRLLPALLTPLTELLNRAVAPLHTPEDRADWPRWRLLAPHCTAPFLSLDASADVSPDQVVAATHPALRAGQYRHELGLYTDAEQELRRVVDLRRDRLGAEHPATLDGRLAHALSLRYAGRFAEAEAEYLAVARCRDRGVPADHRIIQSARGGRARVLRELGDLATAETELRAVLEIRRRQPENHLPLLRTRYDMASVLHERGRLDEAISELEDIQRVARQRYADDHPLVLGAGTRLFRALRDARRFDEAEAIGSAIVAEHDKAGRSEHPDALVTRHELARVIRDQGRLEEARARFAEIGDAYGRRLAPNHPGALASRHELASVLHQLGHLEEAAAHFHAVLAAVREHYDEHHPAVRATRHNLALVLREPEWPGPDRAGETDMGGHAHAGT